MNSEEKTAWIDEENKIVSFHAIDNGTMIRKAESLFWDFISVLAKAGFFAPGIIRPVEPLKQAPQLFRRDFSPLPLPSRFCGQERRRPARRV